MKAEMKETKEESRKLREQNLALNHQLRAVQRRATRIAPPSTPLPSPPKVSSMTHTAYANLNTPSVKTQHRSRMSVGDATTVAYKEMDEEDDLEEENEEDVSEDKKDVSPRKVRAGKSEASEVAKVVAKAIVKPEKFSGEGEKERQEVETWVEDVTAWLDSQFSQFDGDYSEAQWTLVQSLLGGTAKRHMRVAKQTDPSQTWESLKQGLVDFIRGGQESRTLWRQKMDRLVYGRDPCKDLLKLEKEFEQLRIKLFPTSSSDPAMNAEVGRLYAAAIERGSPLLAAEMQRILAVLDQEPSLSQWKSAAVKAEQILKLTAVNWRAGGGGREYPRWGHRPGGESHTQTTGAVGRVHEMSEGVEGEDDTDNPGAALQQVQGRKDSYRRTPRWPPLLTTEEHNKVMAKGLCLQCYKPGHRIKDDVCKEKGQKRRKPTAEELKD